MSLGITSVKNLISADQMGDEEVDILFTEADKCRCNEYNPSCLQGKLLINFFFEESTRTRLSFEIAAKRMGAQVVNIQSALSSVNKGEDFRGSIETISQYGANYIVIRHPESGIFNLLSDMEVTGVINAGDGKREHPTQALGDIYTILQHKRSIKGLIVVLCGDVKSSRVAGSLMRLLRRMGAEIRIVTSPIAMLTEEMTSGIPVFHDMADGLRDADVVVSLRYKREYTQDQHEQKFYRSYKITYDVLSVAKQDVIVMHPGPVLKNVDMDSAIYYDERVSVVTEQVRNCLFVRQALLKLLG